MSNFLLTKTRGSAISFALVVAFALPAIAAAPPMSGIYTVSSYVTSAVATGSGECGAPQGYYLSSYFYYPGPAKAGAVERHSINGPQGNLVQELTFPSTPALQVKTWAGDYRSSLFPQGTSESGTFSTTFTFVDADSFLGTTTYTYPVGQGGTCTTVFKNTYIRTGK